MLSQCRIFCRGSTSGAGLFIARQSAAAVSASLLIAVACFAASDAARAEDQPTDCHRGGARLPRIPDRAMEGRALARRLRSGGGAQGRACADRARRQRRDQIAGRARRPALFLVRGGRIARRRANGTRSSRAMARRRSAAPSRARSPFAANDRRRRAPPGRASGPCATAGTAPRRICTRPGSRSSSTRRSKSHCRGRRCMKCCATPKRNILFNHLGLREDQKKLVIRPDCADLPYFLRAYFAFKMGLPFGYAKCSRGGGGKAPRCPQWWNIVKEEPPPAPPAADLELVWWFLRRFRAADRAASVASIPRGHPGCCRALASTCAPRLPTASIPAMGARRPTTTTPIYYPVPLNAADAAPGHRLRRSLRSHLW